MPQKLQGIAFQRVFSRLSLHEGVIAGIGVLLFFLGLWSSALLTKLFCFAITGVAAFYIFDSLRDKEEVPSGEERGNGPLDEVEEEKSVEDSLPVIGEEAPVESSWPSDHLAPEVPQEEDVRKSERQVRFEEPAQRAEEIRTYSPSDFVDNGESAAGPGQQETKTEFNFLLLKALAVVKEVLFAHSVSFYWINREARQLVLEARVTESEAFSASRKLPLANDIVSRIAITGQPEVVAQIGADAERDIVPYYTSLQEIRSFIGVPVYYPRTADAELPVAVMAIDSKAEDAYGQESVLLLTNFTKMLSAVLKSSTEKYDLINESGMLKTETRFRAKAFGSSEVSDIGNALAEESSALVPWDALTLTLFDDAQKQWVIANVRTRHNHRYVVAKQVLDFHASTVGKAIRNNAVQDIADLSKTTEPRFLINEP